MRIIIVEDNEKLARYTKQMLEEEGFAVDVAADGAIGERMIISQNNYDAIILDVMLPVKDGISVCQSLREQDIMTPIIMVTAKDALDDKILGLDSGADDYVVKPFEIKELIARIHALLRRPQEQFVHKLIVQDLELVPSLHVVRQGETEIRLTLKEYAILEYLMRNVEQVISREQLLEHCWDFAYSTLSNITDVYIKQLRKKLHDTHEQYIQTIRGVGYKLKR